MRATWASICWAASPTGKFPKTRSEGGQWHRTEPLAVIHRQDQKLTPLMESFIQCLKQPEPGEKV
jgi:hypothetical protein